MLAMGKRLFSFSLSYKNAMDCISDLPERESEASLMQASIVLRQAFSSEPGFNSFRLFKGTDMSSLLWLVLKALGVIVALLIFAVWICPALFMFLFDQAGSLCERVIEKDRARSRARKIRKAAELLIIQQKLNCRCQNDLPEGSAIIRPICPTCGKAVDKLFSSGLAVAPRVCKICFNKLQRHRYDP